MVIADFNFDGFSADMTRSMVAMRDVSFLLVFQTLCYLQDAANKYPLKILTFSPQWLIISL